jgi:hypothetical protein
MPLKNVCLVWADDMGENRALMWCQVIQLLPMSPHPHIHWTNISVAAHKGKGRSVCPCRTRSVWVIIPQRKDDFQSWVIYQILRGPQTSIRFGVKVKVLKKLLSVQTVRNELLPPTALWTTSTLLDLKRYSYKCRCLLYCIWGKLLGYPKFSQLIFGFTSCTKYKQILLLVMLSLVFADDRKEPVASLVASERIGKGWFTQN